MDTLVYSAVGPGPGQPTPPGFLLARALAAAGGGNWRAARDHLLQARQDPGDRRAAHYLLWEACQALGQPEAAAASLRAVLADGPVTSRHSANPRRRLLVLAVPGDFQANLPIGALLDAAGTELHTLWLSDPEAVLADPGSAFGSRPRPPFEAVFVAIAEDARHARALAAADRLACWLGVPVINRGALIGALSRVGAARLLRDLPDAVVPEQVLAERAQLERMSDAAIEDDIGFPMIVRPDGSHAGQALERVEDAPALRRYLRRIAGDRFHVAPFIDYASADGHWRKYRIIFVAGRPHPFHLAIHDHWAVWYYNARMERSAWKREEEARLLHDIERALPARALGALHAVGARIGLDYFGLDCGVMPDNRLVLFEVETGMLVHDWDAPGPCSCRSAAVARIRNAAEAMIDARILAGAAGNPGGARRVQLRTEECDHDGEKRPDHGQRADRGD